MYSLIRDGIYANIYAGIVRLILISTISTVNIAAKAYAFQWKKKLLWGFFFADYIVRLSTTTILYLFLLSIFFCKQCLCWLLLFFIATYTKSEKRVVFDHNNTEREKRREEVHTLYKEAFWSIHSYNEKFFSSILNYRY